MKKRVLFFGDSNTWGFIPANGNRFAEDIRWPSVVGTMLSDHIVAVEDAISGRITNLDKSSLPHRNALTKLPYSLAAHAPLDLVVLCIGTNDLKHTDIHGACNGLESLINCLETAEAELPLPKDAPNFPNGLKLLIIAPIQLHPEIETRRPDSKLQFAYEESLKFSEHFRTVAEKHNAWFLDAAQYAQPSIKDCIHMDAGSHLALAEAVTAKIREIFEIES